MGDEVLAASPVRGGRGQRRYSREDVVLIFQIKEMTAQGLALKAISRRLQTDPNSGNRRTIDVNERLYELRNRLVALEERAGFANNGPRDRP